MMMMMMMIVQSTPVIADTLGTAVFLCTLLNMLLMRITARSMQFFNIRTEQQNVTERTQTVFLIKNIV